MDDHYSVFEPFGIKLNRNNNDKIINGMVGEEHTVLLTNKNNVITTPHILCKTLEIGINENDFIKRVIALNYETIIIVSK